MYAPAKPADDKKVSDVVRHIAGQVKEYLAKLRKQRQK
jgi:hypothetical protein